MSKLSTKHLLGIKDLTKEDISLIFNNTKIFKEVINRPIKKVPSLNGISILNLFFENSTRTKISFELAEKRLSADVINFSSSSSSVNKGETLLDTVNNILAMKCDMIVMRHSFPGSGFFLSRKVDIPIINAGDGTNEHPTQALLDGFSIKETLGDLKNKNIVIIGDILHSRVALSNIFLLKKMEANVMVCGPNTLIPKNITSLGVLVETNIERALKWADVANVLRIQFERQDLNYFPSKEEYIERYQINSNLLKKIERKDILILHPGPINRGLELTDEIADGNNSIILNQVENGVAVRMAVLFLLSPKLT